MSINAPEAAGAAVYRVVLAWSILILALVLLARTRAGYTLVYYFLALALVFLVLTQYQFFQWALQPISSGTTFSENAGIHATDTASAERAASSPME